MNRYLEYILSLPKSAYVSCRLCPFKEAIKIPIFVRFNCNVLSLKGKVSPIDNREYKTGMLKIGFGTVGVFDKKYSRSILEISGKLILKGKASFGHGSKICISKNGTIILGDNFYNTAEMTLISYKKITFGDNVLTSWNTLVMDTDFHQTINTNDNTLNEFEKEIIIGDNVWMGTKSMILKGSIVPNGSIIGANAVVNKKYTEEKTLIAGSPARVVKKNITIARNKG